MSERPDKTDAEIAALPANTDSKVGEEAASTDTAAPQGELDDAELEGVAGGFLGGLIKKTGKVAKQVIK